MADPHTVKRERPQATCLNWGRSDINVIPALTRGGWPQCDNTPVSRRLKLRKFGPWLQTSDLVHPVHLAERSSVRKAAIRPPVFVHTRIRPDLVPTVADAVEVKEIRRPSMRPARPRKKKKQKKERKKEYGAPIEGGEAFPWTSPNNPESS